MEKKLIQFSYPGMTQKQYDQVWDELRRAGKSSLPGLIHHVATFKDNNCLIFDVWESSEAFNRFGEVIMPIFNKLGIRQVQPTITPVYFEYSGQETYVAH